jgi:hypothetical protein
VFFTSFEELKNIGNRVAWFLAELCKAERCTKRQAKPALDRAPWGGGRRGNLVLKSCKALLKKCISVLLTLLGMARD